MAAANSTKRKAAFRFSSFERAITDTMVTSAQSEIDVDA
jgi:hypothetical protein